MNIKLVFKNGKLPTVTAQQKRIAVKGGRPIIYDSPKIKQTRKLFAELLQSYVIPGEQIDGPVSIKILFKFPTSKKRQINVYKTSRPDCDNLSKLLLDSITAVGIWGDDAQVVHEELTKIWAEEAAIEITIEEIDNEYKGKEE